MYLTISSFANTSIKIKRLNKRLEKKGLPLITYKAEEKYLSMAEVFPKHTLPKHFGEIMVNVIDFSFTSNFENIHLETGYEIVAVIDHVESLVHVFVEGVDVEQFRNRSVCDHCKTKRNRNKTVILRKGDEFLQIGTKCLSDFFQKNVNDLVKAMELFASNPSYDNSPDEYFSNGRHHSHCAVSLETVLPLAVASIQKYGYASSSETNSTKKVVLDSIFGGHFYIKATQEDKEVASKVLEWMKNLPMNVSCFQSNLRQIADNGFVSINNFGYACYAVVEYFKELAKKAELENNSSEYFGNVGDKVQIEISLVSKRDVQTSFGYSCYHTFKDTEGHTFVWGTSSRPAMRIGDTYKVKATIKEHSEFKGVKQTYLVRVKEI